MNRIPLVDSYYTGEISKDEFQKFLSTHSDSIFSDLLSTDIDALLSEKEKSSRDILAVRMGDPFTLYYGIFQDEKLIGYNFGKQETAERFYMVSTGILPEHQNKGIYPKLLQIVLNRVRDEGFQIAYSRHRATHNAVIIPKLKVGFQITNLEISEKYGGLVHLAYFFNTERREALELRSGKRLPDGTITKLLKLGRLTNDA